MPLDNTTRSYVLGQADRRFDAMSVRPAQMQVVGSRVLCFIDPACIDHDRRFES